ncbi:MAG: hypothetical protein LBH19_08875 [Dysgonamonadaceae bacterium]|nr:hypothetical protein [Dysgonamonadaceae bacterium]
MIPVCSFSRPYPEFHCRIDEERALPGGFYLKILQRKREDLIVNKQCRKRYVKRAQRY